MSWDRMLELLSGEKECKHWFEVETRPVESATGTIYHRAYICIDCGLVDRGSRTTGRLPEISKEFEARFDRQIWCNGRRWLGGKEIKKRKKL